MPGPIPKDPSIRQRRNRVASSATLTVDAGRRRHAPPLPKLNSGGPSKAGADDGQAAPGDEWHPLTRAWWRDVWHSPMASEYLEVDKHGLFRLAALVDAFWRDPSRELAAEIRLQQQCFGLTPIDRRRLQWEVERVEEVTRKKRRVEQATVEPIADPRSMLRVLKG